MDWTALKDDYAYCRDELRQQGFDVSSETFRRWEKRGLLKIKSEGRSTKVRYWGRDFKRFHGVAQAA